MIDFDSYWKWYGMTILLCSVFIIITEEASHINNFLFFSLLVLLLLDFSSCGWSGSTTTSGWGVLGSFKDLISLWEAISTYGTNSNHVLETIQERMRSWGLWWNSTAKRQLCLHLDGLWEFGLDVFRGVVKNLSIEDVSILEDLWDLHLILERIDLKLI